MSAGTVFCACREFLRLIFLGLARANPLGQNAARIIISMSWSAAPGLQERRGEGGEGWSVGLIPSLGHICRSVSAASHPVSHLL